MINQVILGIVLALVLSVSTVLQIGQFELMRKNMECKTFRAKPIVGVIIGVNIMIFVTALFWLASQPPLFFT